MVVKSQGFPVPGSKWQTCVDRLAARIESERQRLRLPSVSVTIVRNCELIFSKAFGYTDLMDKTYATTTTAYPIGSITKVFVATMLMQLAEQGVIKLDDPVTKYVPEYQVRSATQTHNRLPSGSLLATVPASQKMRRSTSGRTTR